MEVIKRKRKTNAADRVVLTAETQRCLEVHAEQIATDMNGMFSVPARELANFLLQARNQPLTDAELQKLRLKYFDKMKALKWAMNELQTAKTRGEDLDLSSLLEKVQMQGVGKIPRPKRPSVKSKSTKPTPAALHAENGAANHTSAHQVSKVD